MTELTNIVAVYGAVDRKVAEDADSREAVSRLLGVYRNPRVRWFDDFEEWAIEKTEGAADRFPPLLEALDNLADFPPRGRMQARRLFLIGVAAQAFPDLRDPDSDAAAMARRALRPLGGRAETDVGAEQLLDLLTDVEILSTGDGAPGSADAWWRAVITRAYSLGLTPSLEQLGPRPCTGQVLPGPRGPEAHLSAGFETDVLTFDQAIKFLDPSTWEECGDFFWCEMQKVGTRPPNRDVYHEIVSLDCVNRNRTWTIEAWLDFTFKRPAGPDQPVAVANYTLARDRPQPDVLVDDGTLLVQQIPGSSRILIQTTKAIRFNRPFSGEALALIMCALGYASVVEDFVFTCGVEGIEGTGFPGETDEESPIEQPRRSVTMSSAPSRPGESERKRAPEEGPSTPRRERPDLGPVLSEIADDFATTMKECVDYYADYAKESYDKMDKGDYKADDLVRDMSRMWLRMLQESANLADFGIRSAQRAAASRQSPPPASGP